MKTRHKRNKTKSKDIMIDRAIGKMFKHDNIVAFGYDLGNGIKGDYIVNKNNSDESSVNK